MNDFCFVDLVLGHEQNMAVDITPADVEAFCRSSGDWSTIHVDDEYAVSRGFAQRLVHGMLIGSYLSAFVGMKLPGRHGLLQSMNCQFRRPCYAPAHLAINGKVVRRSEALRVVTIDIVVTRDAETLVVAQANSVMKV